MVYDTLLIYSGHEPWCWLKEDQNHDLTGLDLLIWAPQGGKVRAVTAKFDLLLATKLCLDFDFMGTYNYYISWRHCLRSLGRNFTWLCTHCTSALQSPMPWGWLFLVRPGPDTASRNVLLYSCCQNLSNLWTKSKQQRRTSEEALGLLIPRFHFRFNHTAVELPDKIQACSIYY